MFKKLRRAWMVFVEILGKVQTTILLSVVYHIAVGPLALAAKLSGQDLLELKSSKDPTYARRLGGVSSTLDRAQRQF
jgi:hypothetical protein